VSQWDLLRTLGSGIGVSRVLREEGLNSSCASNLHSDTTGMGFIRGALLRRYRLEWSGVERARVGVGYWGSRSTLSRSSVLNLQRARLRDLGMIHLLRDSVLVHLITQKSIGERVSLRLHGNLFHSLLREKITTMKKTLGCWCFVSRVLREEGLNSSCASNLRSDTTGMGFIRAVVSQGRSLGRAIAGFRFTLFFPL
jgi:hypothetical protein